MEAVGVEKSVESSNGNGLLSSFFTEEELARELGVSRKSLMRWEAKGRGPRQTRVGRKILYSRRGVVEWLAECERKSSEKANRLRGSKRRRAA